MRYRSIPFWKFSLKPDSNHPSPSPYSQSMDKEILSIECIYIFIHNRYSTMFMNFSVPPGMGQGMGQGMGFPPGAVPMGHPAAAQVPKGVQAPRLQIVVLAGGKGKRMNSGAVPKVLCKFRGKEMIIHILEKLDKIICDDIFVVVNNDSAMIIQHVINRYLQGGLNNVRQRIKYVLQLDVNGTGGALQCVLPNLDKEKYTLVLNGDMPNITVPLVGEFVKKVIEEQVEVGIVSALLDDPADYGRIMRGSRGSVMGLFTGIIEKKDCQTDEERANREINAGIYLFSNMVLHTYLPKLDKNNQAGEYYLTQIFEVIRRHEDNEIIVYQLPREMNAQIVGVNTMDELEKLEQLRI